MRFSLFKTLGIRRETFSTNFAVVFAILVIVFLTVTPKFDIRIYIMALWLVFAMLSLNYIGNGNGYLKRILSLGIIFIIICAGYKFVGMSSAGFVYCIVHPYVFFAPILALFFIDKIKNGSQIRFMLHAISLGIAINVADNIRLFYVFGIENLAFQRLAQVAEDSGFSGFNLGDSAFVTMIVFYTSVMFLAFLKTKSKTEKLLFLLYFVLGTYFIVLCSMKASAVILLLMSLILIYISRSSSKNITSWYVSSIILGGLFYIFRDNIINFLITLIDSDRITSRLVIFTSAGDIEDSTTLMSRKDLWIVSLQSWLSDIGSFLFGIGDHNHYDFNSTTDSGIGNHSDLLDVLGRYGLIGGLILYSSIKIYYDYLMRNYDSSYKWEIKAFFILLISTGLTKQFMAETPAIVIFVLFPLCLKYFSNKQFQY